MGSEMNALMENPWPLALGLTAVGLLIVAASSRGGSQRMLLSGWVLILSAAGLVFVASKSITAGEQARETVTRLVTAVAACDLSTARRIFAAEATLQYGPGGTSYGRMEIDRGLDSLSSTNRIESNEIVDLNYTTVDDDAALVELACRTTTAAASFAISTRWQFDLTRQPDGSMAITRVCFVSVGGQTPSRGVF